MPIEPKVQGQPIVGIFWLLGNRLIFDTSPLSEAEPYGDCLGHEESHDHYWTVQQGLGNVPRDVEYYEHPRGRVVYNTKTQRFALYADRCIVKQKSVVSRVMEAMCLPASQTDVGTDGPGGHYKCSECTQTSEDREDDF